MSGILLYMIGASGSGKESLMRHARETLAADSRVVFAHRYITRPHNAGGENHIALSEAEFNARVERNLFALHWSSHGMRYGIGCELNHWLAKGLTVVLNGSRAHLSDASRNYPELRPILIEVSLQILQARLHARRREDASAVESRLLPTGQFDRLQHPKLVRFSNDAPLAETGPAFVDLIRTQTRMIPCI